MSALDIILRADDGHPPNGIDSPSEVLSTQFDGCLPGDRIADTTEPEDNAPVQFGSRISAWRSPLVVIIADAAWSGRTSVSATLSVHLSDTPVIVLGDVWRAVPAREEATQADFVTALTDVIRQPAYPSKFVVDGLDALPENLDIDQFLDSAA
jgi:hypothetical protein